MNYNMDLLHCFTPETITLASRIDVGQGINIGPGQFGKKNKRRALNTHAYVLDNHPNDVYVLSNKAIGPGKNAKLINLGPMSIPCL